MCRSCGSVLGPVYLSQTDHSSPLYDFEEIDLSPIWRALSKGDSKVNPSIYEKLRIIDRRFRRRRGSRAIECIRNIARVLGIEERYVRIAEDIAMAMARKKRDDVTYYQIGLASLLYVVITHGLPISTKAMVEVCKSLGHKVSLGDMQRSVSLLGGLRYRVRDRVDLYIRSALPRLVNNWLGIYRRCRSIMNNLGNAMIQSKNPLTLAGAVIYCAGKDEGLSIENIARILSISKFTLRDYVRKYLKC